MNLQETHHILTIIGADYIQTNFEQDVHFGIDGTVSYIGGNVTESTSVGFELSFYRFKFSLNGTEIGTGEKNKWYHIVVTADPTVKKCIAKICNRFKRRNAAKLR